MFWDYPKTLLVLTKEKVLDRWSSFTLWFRRSVLETVNDIPEIVDCINQIKDSIAVFPKIRTSISKVTPILSDDEPSSFSTMVIPADPFESVTLSNDSMQEAQRTGDLDLATHTLLWRMQSKKFFLPIIEEHLASKELAQGSPLELRLKALQATISSFPDNPETVATLADIVAGNTNRPNWRDERQQ